MFYSKFAVQLLHGNISDRSAKRILMGKKYGTRFFSLKHFFSGITVSNEMCGQYSTSRLQLYRHPQSSPGYVSRAILDNLRYRKDTIWLLKDGQRKHVVFCGSCRCFPLWFIPGRDFPLPGKNFIYCYSWPNKGGPPFPSYHLRKYVSNFLLLAIL